MGLSSLLRITTCAVFALGIAGAQGGDRGVRVSEPIAVQRKMALVIGNQTYAQVPLQNPGHDADAMAAQLREMRFDSVVEKRDLTNRQLRAAVDAFADSLKPGDLALFYYAGHGIQANELNYLIPVDFAGSEADLPYDAYPATQLRDKLDQSGARLRVLILDACRNNPFRGKRGGGQGLSAMGSQVEGTYIAYATADNGVADDNGREANGLFTRELLRAMATSGLELKEIFERTKENVYAASSGNQRPFTYDGVVGRYYFSSAIPKVTPSPGDPASTRQRLQKLFDDGLAAVAAKQYPEAVGFLVEASRIDPKQSAIWAQLGSAYEAMHEYESSEGAYHKAIELTPNDAGLHNNLGLTLAKLGRVGDAQWEILNGARLDPASAGASHYNLGAILTNLGMTQAGGEEFRNAMTASPPMALGAYQYGLYLMSKAALQNGRVVAPDGTSQAFDRYLSIAKPSDSDPNAQLAKSLKQWIGAAVETFWKRSPGPMPQAVRAMTLTADRTPASYPPLAKAARVQGKVTLRATVNGNGTVEIVEYVAGNPLLVQSAIESVKEWKFQRPPGTTSWARTDVEVNFRLDQ